MCNIEYFINTTHCYSIIAQCAGIAAPTNGMRAPLTGDIAVGMTLTMSCDSGYALVGDATGTCTDAADGTGATFMPDVVSTTCGKLYPEIKSNICRQRNLV